MTGASKSGLVSQSGAMQPLVVRSAVPEVKEYGEYKRYLRYDFYYSCAYCSMTEAEATAIRFTIDHYEPRSARLDLENAYGNLMYACDECNSRKGDLTPPPSARANGFRFFRPDEDSHADHFSTEMIGEFLHLKGITPVGEFSIDNLDLNRLSLKRLRNIRASMLECHSFLVHGIAGLKGFPIDRLHPSIKARAQQAISRTVSFVEGVEEEIDSVLRDYAKSDLVDLDDDQAIGRAKERAKRMKALKVIHPGTWRGRDFERP